MTGTKLAVTDEREGMRVVVDERIAKGEAPAKGPTRLEETPCWPQDQLSWLTLSNFCDLIDGRRME